MTSEFDFPLTLRKYSVNSNRLDISKMQKLSDAGCEFDIECKSDKIYSMYGKSVQIAQSPIVTITTFNTKQDMLVQMLFDDCFVIAEVVISKGQRTM